MDCIVKWESHREFLLFDTKWTVFLSSVVSWRKQVTFDEIITIPFFVLDKHAELTIIHWKYNLQVDMYRSDQTYNQLTLILLLEIPISFGLKRFRIEPTILLTEGIHILLIVL
jgi:hypothetical protein